MPHPTSQTTTQAAQQTPVPPELEIFHDEEELALYQVQSKLFALSLEIAPRHPGLAHPVHNAVDYIQTKDPARAALIHYCLEMAATFLQDVHNVLNEAIDWQVVEATYCPAEQAMIDTPGAWRAIGMAGAQRNGHPNGADVSPAATLTAFAALPRPEGSLSPAEAWAEHQARLNGSLNGNGHGHSNGHSNGTSNGHAAPAEGETLAMPAPRQAAQGPVREPTQTALRGLGRSLRTACEREKRRFYAIAADHGMPVDKASEGAMKAALSEFFGEEITSRSQLDEVKWSRAASGIECRELVWSSPTPRVPRAKAATLKAAKRAPEPQHAL